MNNRNHGWLEVIASCMFSGKSSELIRRIERVKFAKQRIAVFKPSIDNRCDMKNIRSHSGAKVDAFPLNTEQPYEHWFDDEYNKLICDVYAFDETQFFNTVDIIDLIGYLVRNNNRVIVAGLDRDFKSKPFGAMPWLLAMADEVTKLTAICVKCGQDATMTQRLIDGNPAPANSPTIVVGGTEQYEARCRACHEIG